jgi:uncharacterized membrane protein
MFEIAGRELDPEQSWVVAAIVAVGALAAGSLAFPKQVYYGFIWQYFWGPVVADANSAACAVYESGATELVSSSNTCSSAVAGGGIVAFPGYTLVSEAGYMVTLIFMLIGVLYLLRRLEIAEKRSLVFALVPFMLFGGALRVVEDAFDATPAGVEPLVTYPLNTLIISPVIYGTVFLVTLATLFGSVALERRGVVDAYEHAVAVIGSVVLLLTVGYLFFLAMTTSYVSLHLQMLVITLGLATVLAAAVYAGLEAYYPAVNAGTLRVGLVVLWAHAIDGVANVLAADWLDALGIPLSYNPKHPANRIIIDVTETVLPASIQSVIHTSWPFLGIKLLLATAIIWLFDDRFFEESPRYAVLLLVAVIAVGLGPGTRDMLRVTFGI